MTTRNFAEVLDLLRAGRGLEPGDEEKRRVVERGLLKQAPFHRSRNSVADAVLIELYETTVRGVDLDQEPHAFITSNSDDFSLPDGDARQPHPDLASLFAAKGSNYGLGVDGLNQVLLDYFGDEIEELFDRIWYHRSLQHEYRLEDAGDTVELKRLLAIAGPGRRRVEGLYTEPGQLGPYTDFELGMLNGTAFGPALGSRQRMGLPRHMTTSRGAQPAAT